MNWPTTLLLFQLGATGFILPPVHVIPRDSPCYFLTSIAKDRLTVFRKDAIKEIVCKALDGGPKAAKFALYAYVSMPDHLHVVTDSARFV